MNCPFTISMKRFDTSASLTDTFYVIDKTTIVFNACHVDTITTRQINDETLSTRLNLIDGTHIDTLFQSTKHGVMEKRINGSISEQDDVTSA